MNNEIISLIYYVESGLKNNDDFNFKYLNLSKDLKGITCNIKFSVGTLNIEKTLNEDNFKQIKEIYEYINQYDFINKNKSTTSNVLTFDLSNNYVEYETLEETKNIKITDKEFNSYMKKMIYGEILKIEEIKNILIAIKEANQDKKYYVIDQILNYK